MAYSTKRKELHEQFTPEKVNSTTAVPNFQDAQLKDAIDNYQKRMWVNIGKGIGMSPGGCKKRAAEQNFLKKL